LSAYQHINLLLTGASGFLGSYCLPVLAAQSGTLYTLGRRQPAGVGAQQHISANLAIEVPVLPQGLDVVVHVAGLAHTIGPKADAQHFEVNAEGTRHLLRALQQSGLPRQFIYISTVAVYGLVQGEKITEDQPIRPTTAYGTSKAKAEEWIQAWCSRHGVGCCILRLPLVYGSHAPGHWQQMTKALQRGRYVQIGAGTARKSMVAAADVAAFLPQAWELQGIYHLTDGVHPTLAEVHAALAGQLGVPPPPCIPLWLAQSIAQLGSGLNALLGKPIIPLHRATLQKLTLPLTFSDAKVRAAAAWNPGSVVAQLAVGG
jgi:nucleoside-diphosphate-sugar epimerase